MKKIAVFASGNGSNFESLVEAEVAGLLNGHVTILISDRPNAYVIQRAKTLDIPAFYFDPKQYESKKDYETIIIEVLKELEIDLIVLAGYMRLVGEALLQAFPNKIINLHPSLLPAFKGKDAIGQAYHYGARFTGVTVHFVDEGMDTGLILLQEVVRIEQEDSVEQLTVKIHEVEHQLLIKAVNIVLQSNYEIINRRVVLH